ncbi:DUF551 domain-containing protein [Shigella flexneri]|nr:DUF551 domain-containing protein [Shigella flexneri]
MLRLWDDLNDRYAPPEVVRELARIVLASLEADPVKRVNSDQMRRVCLEANRHLDKYDAMAKEVNKLLGRIAPPAPVVPEEISTTHTMLPAMSDQLMAFGYVKGWNACRAAMLHAGNFRKNANSSTNNFREIAETSTNSPVIPGEVLSAILKFARVRADFDDFDGDRRGIGDCLDEAEQELIVTINKYASQLAAEPIATNDVREQTAIPQVPVTPDGWISCSERMPAQDDWILIYSKHGEYMAGQVQGEYVELSDGTLSWLGNALYWMPLPEPPQEAK